MSWKLTKEVRDARHSGLLKNLSLTEFFVLIIMADTCRNESRTANVGVSELMTLTGHNDRTAISRAIKKLITLGCIERSIVGNQYGTASYKLLPFACCADATCSDIEDGSACCADATPTGDPHVASPIPHVASPTEHVALTQSACCADATHPSSEVYIPTSTPEEERASAPPAPSSSGVIEAQEHVAVVEAEVLAAQRTIEPPLGCAQHPNGTTQPCRQCGNAIKKWECSPDGIAFMRNHVMATEMAKQLGKQAARDNQAVLLRGSLGSTRSVDQILGSRPSEPQQSRQLPSSISPPPKAREKPAMPRMVPASVTNNSPYSPRAQQTLDEAKARGERLRADAQALRNNSKNHHDGETP